MAWEAWPRNLLLKINEKKFLCLRIFINYFFSLMKVGGYQESVWSILSIYCVAVWKYFTPRPLRT